MQNGHIDQADFCLGPHMTPGKVYGCSKLQKFVTNSLIIVKIGKGGKKYYLIHELFSLLFKLHEDASRIEPLLKIKIEDEAQSARRMF